MKPLKNEHIILGIIILLGFFIRLYHFNSFSLTNDELSAISRLHYQNIPDLLSQGVLIDFHPAGVQIFLYYWVKVFGNSVEAIRLPFILAATLSILFTYLFSKRWFGSTPALLSAAAIAFLSFPVMYSQIARPYASGLLLILVLAWLWSIVLFPSQNERKHIWRYAILLGLAFAFNLYNHYFSALLAFIIGISALVFINRKNYLPYFSATILATVLFIPHIKITLHHLSKGGLSSWLGAPQWNWPIGHISFIFNSYFILILIVAIIIWLRKDEKITQQYYKIRILLFAYFLLPMLIGLIYSIYYNPVLQDSILIFSMPFIFIWLFSFIPAELNKKALISITILSLSFIITSFTIKQDRAVNVQNFKGIAKHLIAWNKTNTSKSSIRIMDSNSPDYINYYLRDDRSNIQFAQWKIQDDDDFARLQHTLDTCNNQRLTYVVLAPASELVWNMILNHFPYQVQHVFYADNALAYELSKSKSPDFSNLNQMPSKCIAQFKSKEDTLINIENTKYSAGLEYQFTKNNVDANLKYSISLKATFIDSSEQINAHIVFSLSYDNGDSYWASAPLHYFLKPNCMQQVFYHKTLPLLKDTASLKVYIWNPESDKLMLKGIQICLHQETAISD